MTFFEWNFFRSVEKHKLTLLIYLCVEGQARFGGKLWKNLRVISLGCWIRNEGESKSRWCLHSLCWCRIKYIIDNHKPKPIVQSFMISYLLLGLSVINTLPVPVGSYQGVPGFCTRGKRWVPVPPICTVSFIFFRVRLYPYHQCCGICATL